VEANSNKATGHQYPASLISPTIPLTDNDAANTVVAITVHTSRKTKALAGVTSSSQLLINKAAATIDPIGAVFQKASKPGVAHMPVATSMNPTPMVRSPAHPTGWNSPLRSSVDGGMAHNSEGDKTEEGDQ